MNKQTKENGRVSDNLNSLVRRIHLWWLKKKICELWQTLSPFIIEEALIDYGTMKIYMSDGMWIHPCGATVDDQGQNMETDKSLGEWECTCKMCCELRRLILSNM